MKRHVVAGVLAVAGLLPAAPLQAHHSPSAIFDMSKPFVVKGTLTKVDWVNPHIFVFVNAMDGTAWKLESNPPAWFRRVGVSRADFAKAIGQTVTAEGNRAKDGSQFAYLVKVTFADGSSLELVPAGAAAP